MTDTNEKMNKKLTFKSVLIYLSVLILITGISLYMIIQQDLDAVLDNIKSLKLTTWLIIAAIMGYFIFAESLILFLLVRVFKKDYKYRQAIKLRMIGVLFNALTPAATGGQIAQIFVLSKQGVNKTLGASILVVQFITIQIAGIILVGSTIGVTAPMFIGQFDSPHLILLGLVGMVINVVILAFAFAVAYSKKIHSLSARFITFFMTKVLRKKVSKEEKEQELAETFSKFKDGIEAVRKKPKIVILCITLFISAALFNGASAYFVGQDMGIPYEPQHMFSVMSLSVFTNTITLMIPLPGGSGTTEFVYNELFIQFIKTFASVNTHQISSQMIVWRALSFTIPVFIGLSVYLGSRDGLRRKKT